MPEAIHADGRVIGWALRDDGGRHAFIWDGQLRALDAPAGTLTASTVFGPGFIAGSLTDEHGQRAVIWEAGVIRDLGVPGAPTRANARGDMVLHHRRDDKQASVILYQAGATTGLPIGSQWSTGRSLSSDGAIAGYRETHDRTGRVHYRGFLWQNGALRELDHLGRPHCESHAAQDCSSSTASDANNRGEIVGASRNDAGANRPVIWRDGVISELAFTPSSDAGAVQINDRGQIVILAGTRAFIRDAGTTTELFGPAGQHVSPHALSETGIVAGHLFSSGVTRAFVWIQGRMIELGTLTDASASSMAIGVNDRGDVIGYIEGPAFRQRRAVLWRRN